MQNLSINVPLTELELNALVTMAQVSCRAPREQLRFLLRRQAQRRGLLPDVAQKNPLVASALAGVATSGVSIQPLEKDSTNAESTQPA